MTNLKKLTRFLKLTSPLLLILIGGAWLPDGLKDGQLFVSLGGLLIFFGGSWWAFVQRREYFFVHIATKKVRGHKVLIMPISNIKDISKLVKRISESGQGYEYESSSLNPNFAEMVQQELRGFPWQQTMRGIERHQSELKRVYLLGSKGEQSSFAQLPQCRELINHYLPELEVKSWPVAVDFEDLEEMLDGLYKVIKDAQQEYKLRDIMLDVTAGPKITSIAAALVTLNLRALEFQYVTTTSPYKVIGFNTNAEKNEIGT